MAPKLRPSRYLQEGQARVYEDWKQAPGVIATEGETNAALTTRDYSYRCERSPHPIIIFEGYWFWWCTAHHQPLCRCDHVRAAASAERDMMGRIKKRLQRKSLVKESVGWESALYTAGMFMDLLQEELTSPH